jgi:RND family efflux transporter MFP subunit
VALQRRSLYGLIALCGFALYIAGEVYFRHRKRVELAHETAAAAVMTVSVTHPKHPDPVQTITLPGNILAWHQAPIYARVPGYVKMWFKDYGAEVKEGDVLAELSTPTLEAQYRQAQAEVRARLAKYKLAALTAKRYRAMAPSQAVSLQSISVKEAEASAELAELKASQNNVANFEAMLKFRIIVAPYDGVVISREINVGDYVNKEGTLGVGGERVTNLFTVADVHRLRLFVSIPESFGRFLKPGFKAEVKVPQFPGRKFEAPFLTVAKGFDPRTRTAVTEFVLENQDRSLWPGSYAAVRLSAPVAGDLLVIPTTCLVFQERGTQVATVRDGSKVHFKDIEVAQIREGTIEVVHGLVPEDLIIDHPSAALLEGETVRIVQPARGYGGGSKGQ